MRSFITRMTNLTAIVDGPVLMMKFRMPSNVIPTQLAAVQKPCVEIVLVISGMSFRVRE